MRTRVKICGITRPEDAWSAAELGADAIGLVFYEHSRRALTIGQARAAMEGLPPFVTVVGLFLDAQPSWVEEVLDALPLDLLQFHGDEPPQCCGHFGRRYLKAVPLGDELEPSAFARRYPDAAGFLLDSNRLGEAGGTGERFDWRRIPSGLHAPLILAGGLNPDNVAEAVSRVRPWGVDVSSGVESAPGIKNRSRMAAFIEEVQRVQGD